ncbi:hypothetical protein RF11_12108 [Thelohanellus kitauei]|uniref:Uncharacterized protein n=1 Tax=Thelohanellus kitauei TaxID=669202 RepID=A0A0C2NIL4_THEKT|nr:hypothetical protein RF11_12108 [Thelohanellus kitauei]
MAFIWSTNLKCLPKYEEFLCVKLISDEENRFMQSLFEPWLFTKNSFGCLHKEPLNSLEVWSRLQREKGEKVMSIIELAILLQLEIDSINARKYGFNNFDLIKEIRDVSDIYNFICLNYSVEIVELLYFWLLNRKDDKYQLWKRHIIDSACLARMFRIINNLYSENVKICTNIWPYIQCCVAAFGWCFDDIDTIYRLLTHICEMLEKRNDSDNHIPGIVPAIQDFFLNRLFAASTPNKMIGFSENSHFMILKILFQLTKILVKESEQVVKTVEQIFSICLFECRQPYQLTYLDMLPQFIGLLGKFSYLFTKKYIRFICICLYSVDEHKLLLFQAILKAISDFLVTVTCDEDRKIFLKIILKTGHLMYKYHDFRGHENKNIFIKFHFIPESGPAQ